MSSENVCGKLVLHFDFRRLVRPQLQHKWKGDAMDLKKQVCATNFDLFGVLSFLGPLVRWYIVNLTDYVSSRVSSCVFRWVVIR